MHTIGRWVGGALMMAAALGITAAATAADEALPGPLAALQGTWTSGGVEGEGVGTWTFEGSTLKVAMPAMNYVADVTVDPAVQPARIDFTITEGQAEVVGETVLGVVHVEGDRATICVRAPGDGRPSTLEAGNGTFRFTLTRKAG